MANPEPRGARGRLPPAPGARHPGAADGPVQTWRQALRRHQYLLLLTILVCALIVQSLERSLVGVRTVTEALVGLSLFAMVLVVFEGHRTRFVALCAGGIVVALGWARLALPEISPLWLDVAQKLLLMLSNGWAAALILRNVFQQERIRTDDVLGAVSGYLLAAWAWASLFLMFDTLVPGSFTISPDLAAQFGDPQGRTALFTYFSLAAITSVGYGDIVPVRGPMTALAMLETVFGQFYIAVVVAQLVGMRLAQGPRGGSGGW
jgi:voltage-gated potassium channel